MFGGGAVWVARSVERLPSAQRLPLAWVMVSGTWGRAPHRASCSAGSLLLSLPLPLPMAHFFSLK